MELAWREPVASLVINTFVPNVEPVAEEMGFKISFVLVLKFWAASSIRLAKASPDTPGGCLKLDALFDPSSEAPSAAKKFDAVFCKCSREYLSIVVPSVVWGFICASPHMFSKNQLEVPDFEGIALFVVIAAATARFIISESLWK